ncbi:MAG: hypothetical protein J7639_33660, partial [Paenibacillaceae bacterium]|nr:hypothetical protein [Paenibacillaceae bacterium]
NLCSHPFSPIDPQVIDSLFLWAILITRYVSNAAEDVLDHSWAPNCQCNGRVAVLGAMRSAFDRLANRFACFRPALGELGRAYWHVRGQSAVCRMKLLLAGVCFAAETLVF